MKARMPKLRVSLGIVFLSLSELTACTLTRVHADGTVEYWGLAHVTLRALPEQSPVAAAVAVEGIGALLIFSPAGSAVTIGYASQSITVVRDNALVYLPPRSICHASGCGEQTTPVSTRKEEQP